MIYLILLLCIAIVFLIALLFVKIRRIDKNVWNIEARIKSNLENEFRQLHALDSLKSLTGLKAPLPYTRSWAGSPDFLLHILSETLDSKPAIVVECSCGVSTVVLARAVQLNGVGHVYSFEHDEEFAQKTLQNLKKHDLSDFATVIHAPLTQYTIDGEKYLWYEMADIPFEYIDLLVIDGPPGDLQSKSRFPALPLLKSKLKVSSVVYVDDANRKDEKIILEKWQQCFPRLICENLDAEKGLARLKFTFVEF